MTIVLSLVETARAAEIYVPGDHETLADAVQASGEGDTIWVDAVDYVSDVATTSITIDHDLTIRGVGGRPVLRQGHPDEGFFKINAAGIEVTLDGLEIDGGGVTPALRLAQGELVLRDIVTRDTWSASVAGGAVHVEAVAGNVLLVEDSTLTDSGTGSAQGGVLAALGGSVTLRRTTVARGVATDHGGLVYSEDTSLQIEDSTLSDGTASKRGGGVYAVGEGGVTLRRTRLEGNSTQGDRGGGALYNEGPAVLVEDVWFVGNIASLSEGGGAVHHREGGATYTRVVFCDNEATRGGAMRVQAGEVSLTNAVLLGNDATNEGGGLYLHNGAATLSHVSVSSSKGGTTKPGQAAWSDGVLAVVDSYLADHAEQPALAGKDAHDASTASSAYWNNAEGDFVNADDLGGNLFDDSLIPPPPVGSCDPLDLWPPPFSPLIGAGSSGSDIGAFGGPETWADLDHDGYLSLVDCDDDDAERHPESTEIPADGVDQDCDGMEQCYADVDEDGHGEAVILESLDLDCDDLGEASVADDVCPGADDDLDADTDGVPDGCEETTCTTDPPTGPSCVPPDGGAPTRGPDAEAGVAIGQVGCGCAAASPAPASLWALAALVALGRRRRG
jgi:MYXO-CTERM domain-containing protein